MLRFACSTLVGKEHAYLVLDYFHRIFVSYCHSAKRITDSFSNRHGNNTINENNITMATLISYSNVRICINDDSISSRMEETIFEQTMLLSFTTVVKKPFCDEHNSMVTFLLLKVTKCSRRRATSSTSFAHDITKEPYKATRGLSKLCAFFITCLLGVIGTTVLDIFSMPLKVSQRSSRVWPSPLRSFNMHPMTYICLLRLHIIETFFLRRRTLRRLVGLSHTFCSRNPPPQRKHHSIMTEVTKKKASPLVSLVTGCIAGCIECTVVWPMEYIKTQLQLQRHLKIGEKPPFTGVVSGLVHTVKTTGFLSLYNGLGVTLVSFSV